MSQGWKYGATNSLTPTTGTPNISLETAASEFSEVMEFFWGGEVTTSTAMRTGCFRASEGTGGTALSPNRFAENQTVSPRTSVLTPAYGADPAPENQAFFQTAWNAHGGVIRWLAAPGEEIIMLGVSTVILENQTGTAASTYGFIWGER